MKIDWHYVPPGVAVRMRWFATGLYPFDWLSLFPVEAGPFHGIPVRTFTQPAANGPRRYRDY